MIDNSRKGMCSGSRNLFKFCLGPGDIVLDGQLSTQKRGTAPLFGPCLLWPNGKMDQDATWYGGRPLCPGRILLDGDPAPPKKGRKSPGNHVKRGSQDPPVSESQTLQPFLANVRYMLYAIARPSVCRLSVTLVSPTQAVVIFGNFSTAFDSLAIR